MGNLRIKFRKSEKISEIRVLDFLSKKTIKYGHGLDESAQSAQKTNKNAHGNDELNIPLFEGTGTFM